MLTLVTWAVEARSKVHVGVVVADIGDLTAANTIEKAVLK